jgi:RNA polymerase sigma-70 factor (ECF subfamily)
LDVQNEDDRRSFERVVVPHLADALTLARWLTGNRADAEDVVQESSLRAFRSIGQFSGNHSRSWVLTIVRNTAYSWMRNNRSATLVPVEDLDDEQRIQAASAGEYASLSPKNPETELLERVDESRLEGAIAGLPTEFREALVLRDMQGLGYREIAEVVGAPVGTVMSRLARARQRLIKAVKADQT